jgi:hypothetical protein
MKLIHLCIILICLSSVFSTECLKTNQKWVNFMQQAIANQSQFLDYCAGGPNAANCLTFLQTTCAGFQKAESIWGKLVNSEKLKDFFSREYLPEFYVIQFNPKFNEKEVSKIVITFPKFFDPKLKAHVGYMK